MLVYNCVFATWEHEANGYDLSRVAHLLFSLARCHSRSSQRGILQVKSLRIVEGVELSTCKGGNRTVRFATLNGFEIEQLGAPPALVDGLLYRRTYASLVGEAASYKSFIAMDIAFSVATGRPWQGRTVQRGSVLYAAAEGAHTVRDRHYAWRIDRGCDDTHSCRFVTEAINLRS